MQLCGTLGVLHNLSKKQKKAKKVYDFLPQLTLFLSQVCKYLVPIKLNPPVHVVSPCVSALGLYLLVDAVKPRKLLSSVAQIRLCTQCG